jgi:hypothetical protein
MSFVPPAKVNQLPLLTDRRSIDAQIKDPTAPVKKKIVPSESA